MTFKRAEEIFRELLSVPGEMAQKYSNVLSPKAIRKLNEVEQAQVLALQAMKAYPEHTAEIQKQKDYIVYLENALSEKKKEDELLYKKLEEVESVEELSIKVNDNLYGISGNSLTVYKVKEISINEFGIRFATWGANGEMYPKMEWFHLERIGQILFKTIEEAKELLKEEK